MAFENTEWQEYIEFEEINDPIWKETSLSNVFSELDITKLPSNKYFQALMFSLLALVAVNKFQWPDTLLQANDWLKVRVLDNNWNEQFSKIYDKDFSYVNTDTFKVQKDNWDFNVIWVNSEIEYWSSQLWSTGRSLDWASIVSQSDHGITFKSDDWTTIEMSNVK